MAVSGVCSGVPEENSRKVPGKLLEKFSRIAKCYNSRISGTHKGKPAGNFGSTVPGPCPHLPVLATGILAETSRGLQIELCFKALPGL